MKRFYLLFTMLILSLVTSDVWAVSVKVTMNTVSPTMSLQKKGGDAVAVGTPASRVYTFEAEAGDYILTAYATDGKTVNGTIELTVAEGATNEFPILTNTAYATNSGWTLGTDYTMEYKVAAKTGGNRTITAGSSTTAGRATFLAMTGDSYYVDFIPSEAKKAAGFTSGFKNGTLSGSAGATVSLVIPAGLSYSVTVPADANFFMGRKISHYMPFVRIAPTDSVVNGSYKVITYTLADAQQYNYRTWKEDGLTQGGIFTASTTTANMPTLNFTSASYQQASPNVIKRDNLAQTGDIYVNINERGHLRLKKNETYDATALRNWEAINSVTANYFLEPDFHYTVTDLSGNADNSVIELDTYNTTTSPWVTITAKQKGTAIVTVTYDAINLLQYTGATASEFVNGPLYGAIWPENTAVYVVTVDDDETTMDPNMTINESLNTVGKNAGKYVDAELDVFYYVKSQSGAKYTFKPEGVASVTMARPTIGANSATYKGFSTTGVTKNEDGSYTLELKNGRSIVCLTDEAGNSTYQVLTAKSVDIELNSASREYAQKFFPGEKVAVKFSTLFHPANKLAGVYNMNATAMYGTSTGAASQYAFASTETCQTVTVTLPTTVEDNKYTLQGGVIKVSGWGDYFGNHRGFTKEAGRNPNLNAGQSTAYFGQLPVIEIPVSEAQNFDTYITYNVEGAGALVKDAAGKVVTATGGKYSLTYGTYTYEAKATGYRPQRGSFSIFENQVGDVSVSINLEQLPEGAWDGTTKKEPAQVDGVYQISTGAELAWFAYNVNTTKVYTAKGVLTNDIDLGDFSWTPIGGTAQSTAFKGTFDGQYHKVSGLYINSTTATYQGLFGYLYGATVKNVRVAGSVYAKQYASGIAPYAYGATTIENCGNEADITTTGTYSAGICANANSATAVIRNCYNTGKISGTGYQATIVASSNTNTTIERCVGLGSVTSTAATTGNVRCATTVANKIKNNYVLKHYTYGQSYETIVSQGDVESGKLAYTLGEPWGQDVATQKYPIPGGKKVYLLGGQYVNTYNDLKGYEIRTLTFEDADSKGVVNFMNGESTWSSLIDNVQYGGPILYDYTNGTTPWFDENNTELIGGANDDEAPYYSGGWAISNYYMPAFKGAGYTEQLAIAQPETANQFAVVYSYRSGSIYDMAFPTPLAFADGKAHVVESADVALTSYTLNSLVYGDGFNPAAKAESWFAVNFEGTHEDGTTATVTVKLFENRQFTTDWTKIDLTPMGAVTNFTVYTTGSEDMCGDYGLNAPGYVAVDNIAVRFDKKEISCSIELNDATGYTRKDEITVDKISYSKTLADGGWYSCVLPYEFEIPEDVSVLNNAQISETTISFDEVTGSVPANTPFLYRKDDGGNICFEVENITVKPSEQLSSGQLLGTFIKIPKGEATGKLILNSTGSAFATATENASIPAFRAYIEKSSSSSNVFTIVINDDVTGVASIDTDGSLNTKPVDVYTIEGKLIRKAVDPITALEGLDKGIYIINGKKIKK